MSQVDVENEKINHYATSVFSNTFSFDKIY